MHLLPAEAYGEADPNAIFTVEIARLPGAETLTAGQRVYLQDNYGLQVNTDDFYIHYEAFAPNLPPTIKVTAKEK